MPAWPAYDAKDRATRIFDLECKVVSDPMAAARKVLQA